VLYLPDATVREEAREVRGLGEPAADAEMGEESIWIESERLVPVAAVAEFVRALGGIWLVIFGSSVREVDGFGVVGVLAEKTESRRMAVVIVVDMPAAGPGELATEGLALLVVLATL